MNKKFLMGPIAVLVCGAMLGSVASAGDVVVVMSASAAPMTKDQVAGVYLGRNNSLKPVDLPESNSIRQDFYKKATDRDSAQVKAVWCTPHVHRRWTAPEGNVGCSGRSKRRSPPIRRRWAISTRPMWTPRSRSSWH